MLEQGRAGTRAARTCDGSRVANLLMWHSSWSARQRRSLTAECVLVRQDARDELMPSHADAPATISVRHPADDAGMGFSGQHGHFRKDHGAGRVRCGKRVAGKPHTGGDNESRLLNERHGQGDKEKR
jgi:hypothetical protein